LRLLVIQCAVIPEAMPPVRVKRLLQKIFSLRWKTLRLPAPIFPAIFPVPAFSAVTPQERAAA
jgi:hypothetical protein